MQLALWRDAHLFATRPGLMERMEKLREPLPLAGDQLLHPEAPHDYIVRRGKVRVTELMPDGREITRAVLQAGAALRTRVAGEAADPGADTYLVADLIIAALGEVELWRLPGGALDETA